MSGFLSAVNTAETIIDTAGLILFKNSFELCPIFLSGGIAQGVYGGLLPITSILVNPGLPFTAGLLDPLLDRKFAHFEPLPGSTLIDNKIGEYPFANQAVAGNAIIQQPLTISLLMNAPAQTAGSYPSKLVAFQALQATLTQHTNLGGTYTVATPAFIWNNAILLRLSDVSSAETKQRQYAWQWDFRQPLLSLAAASQALSNTMQKISSGLPTNGQPTGAPVTVGNVSTNQQPVAGGMGGGDQPALA